MGDTVPAIDEQVPGALLLRLCNENKIRMSA